MASGFSGLATTNVVYHGHVNEENVERERMVTSRLPLIKGIAKSFDSPNYADLTIHIGELKLPAHSLVLVTQSEYFRAALSGNFLEGKTKELRFEEGSVHAHWRVFEYVYTGNYSEDSHQAFDTPDDDELTKDVKVYVLADMFLLDHLKEYALNRFKEKVKDLWISEAFTDCIKEIYNSTQASDRMRDAVVGISRANLSKLWTKKAFQELIRDGGDFVVDLTGKFV